MKKMKKVILVALITVFTMSCEDFEGWNIDEKHPAEVSGAYLFTNAELELARAIVETDVNRNVFKMFAQQWTETQYTDEANYDLAGRNIGGNFWTDLYYNVLANTTDAKKSIANEILLGENQMANQLAMIEILEVFTFHVAVDVYGDIPYSEALLGLDNLIPKYDDDAEVYPDLARRLDLALNTLSLGGVGFEAADLFYGGDVDSWITFGNSLKLRMAVRMSDANPTMAKTMATQAYDAGVMDTNADNFIFPFESSPPNTNPIWEALVQSGRNDFVPANTYVDFIVPLNDPRTAIFLADNLAPEPYQGGIYGEGNSYAALTHIGDVYHEADFPGMLMSASEVAFLVAEASARGLITADAKTYYEKGIMMSMDRWDISSEDVTAYMAQPAIAYDAAEWKKSIGAQKYISLYGRGFEAWASWKLLDEPKIMNRPPISEEAVPRRYIYPNTEEDVNGANYEAGSAAIGGDTKASRVFWDINGVGN